MRKSSRSFKAFRTAKQFLKAGFTQGLLQALFRGQGLAPFKTLVAFGARSQWQKGRETEDGPRPCGGGYLSLLITWLEHVRQHALGQVSPLRLSVLGQVLYLDIRTASHGHGASGSWSQRRPCSRLRRVTSQVGSRAEQPSGDRNWGHLRYSILLQVILGPMPRERSFCPCRVMGV